MNVQLNPTITVDSGKFMVLDGSLPPGLTLSEEGLVSGTVDAEAPYRGYTVNVGYGASREFLATMRPFRIDVAPPSSTRPKGCSAVDGLGLMNGLALLWLARRRRR